MRVLYKFQTLSIVLEDDGTYRYQDGERDLYSVRIFFHGRDESATGYAANGKGGKMIGIKKSPVVLEHHKASLGKNLHTYYIASEAPCQ